MPAAVCWVVLGGAGPGQGGHIRMASAVEEQGASPRGAAGRLTACGRLARCSRGVARTVQVDDLVTNQTWKFELELEWKMGRGGNAAFSTAAPANHDHIYWSAPEYQLLDDANARRPQSPEPRPRGLRTLRRTGRNCCGPSITGPHAPGRERCARGALAQWHKVVEYELWSTDWKAKVASSKFAAYPH